MAEGKAMVSNPRAEMVANATLLRSELISRLLDGVGRDINSECKYPTQISSENYHEMYEREGVARRVVECIPQETWPEDPEIYETEDTEETEFEVQVKALNDEMNIYHFLHRADELSGIGRFGIILLGLDDGKQLHEPVEGVNARGEPEGSPSHTLLYLRVFDESVLQVQETEKDQTNPRYGQPIKYGVTYQDNAENSQIITSGVHWSRVIHVADSRRMSEVYGTPRMKPVYNRLMDLRKILGGSGEMFWKGGFPGYSFEVNPDLAEAGATVDAEAMREEFEKYSNGLQRYLALTGVVAKSLGPQVADPTGHIEANLKAIAISLSIPFRILFGSEQAQLAASQDAKSWAKRIKKRQEKYINPMILRPFIDRLILFGILPVPVEYHISWPDMNTPTDLDKAQVASTRTQAIAAYVSGGVDVLIPPRAYLTQILKMETEEVDAIEEEADEYAKKAEEEAAAQEEADALAAEEAAANMPPVDGQAPNNPGDPASPFPPAGPKGPPRPNDKKSGPASGYGGRPGRGGQPPFPPKAPPQRKKQMITSNEYDPDQPRADDGKWSSTGAGSSGGGTDTKTDTGGDKKPGPFDMSAWKGKDMETRRADWAKLSTEEQDAMANAQESIPQEIKTQVSGIGVRPTSGKPFAAAKERLGQLGEKIGWDASARVQASAHRLSSALEELGVDEDLSRKITLDVVDTLAVQESESLGRTLGDHGARHILSNAEYTRDIVSTLQGSELTAQQQVEVELTAVYHDTGYLTKPSQNFLDNRHRDWSTQHFEANVRADVEKAIGKESANKISKIIATHDDPTIDWEKDPTGSAFRVSDNMALFHREKLPGLFKYVPENVTVLEKLGRNEIGIDEAHKQVVENISTTRNLSAPMRQQLNKAAEEMNVTTPKFTLGMLGGQITGVRFNDKTLEVSVERNQTAARLQKVLDLGQAQFSKFAKSYGQDPKTFAAKDEFKFGGPPPALHVKVSGVSLQNLMALRELMTGEEGGNGVENNQTPAD